MSRAAIFSHWRTPASKSSQADPTNGAKPVLLWFGVCLTAAIIGMTLTSEVPGERAQMLLAKAQ